VRLPTRDHESWLSKHASTVLPASTKTSRNGANTPSGDLGKSTDCASKSCAKMSKSKKKKHGGKKSAKIKAKEKNRRMEASQTNPDQHLNNKKATKAEKKPKLVNMAKNKGTKVSS
jgi:hypothetical protein